MDVVFCIVEVYVVVVFGKIMFECGCEVVLRRSFIVYRLVVFIFGGSCVGRNVVVIVFEIGKLMVNFICNNRVS